MIAALLTILAVFAVLFVADMLRPAAKIDHHSRICDERWRKE